MEIAFALVAARVTAGLILKPATPTKPDLMN
jgi:hypothetical protein